MRLLPLCSMVIVVGLAACSDDGVPADSTGTDSGASTGTMTSATPSTSSPTSSSTTDDASTSGGENTTGGSDSTFGPEGSGTTIEDPTGTASTTEPTSTGESSSSSGSGSDSGSGTESGSGSGSGSDSGSDTGGPGPGEVGAECKGDMQCDSGVCWDWSDYDMFCFGAVCSVPCMGDDECVAAFTEAGAPFPENVYCGDDDLCVPLESGFGGWACAAQK